ncbi:MAG TPA: hypothetical protein VNO24_11230 [Blastocatellia bacterium]|nr:hypothetical protein [Blastocatellia bacterium]
MKGLNTKWKVIALGTFAVMVTIWTGSRMEAKSGQDYTAQSARVRPRIREAALNLFGPIGFTRGQTLRFGLLRRGQNGTEMTVVDCGGNTLLHAIVQPGPLNTCSSFDLNADQLPQGEFDNSGRAEVSVDWGDGNGSFFATVQVFDNNTGKTTFALQAGGHPGGIN